MKKIIPVPENEEKLKPESEEIDLNKWAKRVASRSPVSARMSAAP